MTLRFTQPVTELSISNLPREEGGGEASLARKADKPTPICESTV
jgi:hypothetical protein